jgi:hypothetical protein
VAGRQVAVRARAGLDGLAEGLDAGTKAPRQSRQVESLAVVVALRVLVRRDVVLIMLLLVAAQQRGVEHARNRYAKSVIFVTQGMRRRSAWSHGSSRNRPGWTRMNCSGESNGL